MTGTPPAGVKFAYLPAVMAGAEPAVRRVYLPAVLRPALPDLVVEQVTMADGGLAVTLRNIGAAPVVEEFWVDVYIAPAAPPTAVNQTWDLLGGEGLVWGVTAAALPLAPGAQLTLAVGDAYYRADYSLATQPLAGRALYVQVDSYGDAGDYGAILEAHELDRGPYNNIFGPVWPAEADATAAAPSAQSIMPPRRSWLPGAASSGEE